jgi:ubiquinone/menaquinone biosynthesis C-methylase UbiE
MPNSLKIFQVHPDLREREKIYIEVRKKEQRLYADDAVKRFPAIDKKHILVNEWRIRADSYYRLEKYITDKNKELEILDLGCGNGWMSNRISSIEKTRVTGLDVNMEELEQASRVFNEKNNLQFIYGDVFDRGLNLPIFDLIICASSVQYFQDLSILIERLFEFLNDSGEIHIIDSPIYDEGNAVKAKERSTEYYKNTGVERMATFYHHHTIGELKNYSYKITGDNLLAKIKMKFNRNKAGRFPWIIIYKK